MRESTVAITFADTGVGLTISVTWSVVAEGR